MKKMVLIPYDQFVRSTPGEHLRSDIHSPQENNHTTGAFFDTDMVQSAPKLDKELILYPFGKRQINHAKTLLSYIENKLSWNDKGEIIINGETIEGSHVSDLLKDALCSYKKFKPIGYESFYKSLTSVPQFLIRNPERRILIGGSNNTNSGALATSQPPPPPPGIPIDKKPVQVLSTLDQWKLRWTKI